jgi:ferric-dicitrate binding protein FerR (iron transport regulator)
MSGEITDAENKEFLLFIQLTDDDKLAQEFSSFWDSYQARHLLSEIRSKEILRSVGPKQKNKRMKRVFFRVSAVAAVFAILLVLGFFAQRYLSPVKAPVEIHAEVVGANIAVGYDRVLTLSDSSRIVLKAGSKLFISQTFGQIKREIALEGEAYFDIVHDRNKPFIIQTGQIKTTVLGTAFNIRALPGNREVNVSVARGKVRVENSEKVLAILSENEGVHYNLDNGLLVREDPEATQIAIRWVSADLVFDHLTLSEIAKSLSKRYGVNIRIENNELADMVLVSSFQGTESLSDILDILCGINPNTIYHIEHNNVVISSNHYQKPNP